MARMRDASIMLCVSLKSRPRLLDRSVDWAELRMICCTCRKMVFVISLTSDTLSCSCWPEGCATFPGRAAGTGRAAPGRGLGSGG